MFILIQIIFLMINYIMMFFDDILLLILRLKVFLQSKGEVSKRMDMSLWVLSPVSGDRLSDWVFIALLILLIFKTCRLLLVMICNNNNVFRKLIILIIHVAGVITLFEILSNYIRLRIRRQLSFKAFDLILKLTDFLLHFGEGLFLHS